MEALRKELDNAETDEKKAEIFESMIKYMDEQKAKQKAYRQSEKGKAALKRANAKYWAKKRSGKPRGRPKKESAKL